MKAKTRVVPCCEWVIYESGKEPGSNSRNTRCSEEGKLYKRDDGKGFDVILDYEIVKDKKSKMRLCSEHYRELKEMIPNLVEA